MPQVSVMDRPGAAFQPRTSSLNRKRCFRPLYYLDANHEQILRERITQMAGFVPESTDASRTRETEGSLTQWQSTSATISRLTPAAEADEDITDFTFGDSPSAGTAAVSGQDDSH